MKKSVRRSFYEATDNLNCKFHRVVLVGELSYYAVKRAKRKRRKYGKSR